MKEKLLFLLFTVLCSTYTVKAQKVVPEGGFKTQNSQYDNAKLNIVTNEPAANTYANLAANTYAHLGYQSIKTTAS